MATALHKETSERIELTAGKSNTTTTSASETQFVKEVILDVEKEIDALNAEVSRIQDQIAQRTARLQRLRAAIAPHKRLPLELLTSIFVLTLHDPWIDPDDNLYLEIPIARDKCPWSLRQVCSSWRRIALNHYPLWSRIRVSWRFQDSERSDTDSDDDSDHRSKLKRWLGNLNVAQRILPPSVPLFLSIYPPTFDEDLIETAIDALVIPHLHRISCLQLKWTSFPGLHKFFELPENSLAEIKVLILNAINMEDNHWRTTSAFKGAKNLHDISLSGSTALFDSILGLQDIPWGQLTNLSLFREDDFDVESDIKYSTALPALNLCQNLISLKIMFTEKVESLQTRPHLHVILPNLKEMDLTIRDPFPLTRFTLPSLTDLVIRCSCAFPSSEVHSMIKRSSCRLKKFGEKVQGCSKMDHPAGYAPGAIELYRSFETLESLFTTLKFKLPLIEEFASGKILPSLHTLSCRFDTSVEDLLVALKPRFGWKDPLKASCTGLRSFEALIDILQEDFDNLRVDLDDIDTMRSTSKRILAEYATCVSFTYYCI